MAHQEGVVSIVLALTGTLCFLGGCWLYHRFEYHNRFLTVVALNLMSLGIGTTSIAAVYPHL